jgi:hypothetical protein
MTVGKKSSCGHGPTIRELTTRWLTATAILACLASGDRARGESVSPQSRLYAELARNFPALPNAPLRLVVQERRRVDASRDVIIVKATAAYQKRVQALGVFVVDRRTSRHRFTLDTFTAEPWLDYAVGIREVTRQRLVVTREGGAYGRIHDLVTYFWDLDAGAVPERLVHERFAIADIVQHDGAIWAAGSDGTRGGIVRLGPPGARPAAEVVATVGGQPVPSIHEMRVEGGELVLLGPTTSLLRRGGRWEATPNAEAAQFRGGRMTGGAAFGVPDVRFWVPEAVVRRHLVSAGTRKFLVWASAIAVNAHGGPVGPGIWEIDEGGRFHAMPAPTYDTFRTKRPGRVADGYSRDETDLGNGIGPIQVEGRRIWFGTTFYDGEGTSGVGGIGSFDVDTRRWRLVYPRALADWSSSAILVEPDAVWLGLVQNTEGRGRDGALLRWDRKTGDTRRVPMAGIAVIRRFGRLLYVGAADGVFIVDGAKVTQARVFPQRGGGLGVTLTRR